MENILRSQLRPEGEPVSAAAAYYYSVEWITAEERERLIIEHLPQVRLIARKIHERLPDTIILEIRSWPVSLA